MAESIDGDNEPEDRTDEPLDGIPD